MHHALFYGLLKLHRMRSRPASHIACAHRHCKGCAVHRSLHTAKGRGLCRRAFWRGRRFLTACHTIYVIIHHNNRKIYISGCRMQEMISTDSEAIPVSRKYQNFFIRLRELEALRKRQRPAVHRMDAIKLHVARNPRRAAYARHAGHFIRDPEAVYGPDRRHLNYAVSAARTKKCGESLCLYIFLI